MERRGIGQLADRLTSRREWLGIWLGFLVLGVAVYLDASLGETMVLVAGYALAAFVPAMFGARLATVFVVVAVMLAAVTSREWNSHAEVGDLRIQIVLVFLGTLLALHVSRVRYEANRGYDRLNILTSIAEAVNSSVSGEDMLRIVESIVVPAFADFYMIDRVFREESGEVVIERASVSVSGPRAAEILPTLQERRSSVPPGLVAADHPDDANPVVLVSPVTDDRLKEIAQSPEDFEFLRSLEMNSYLHVVLRARGEVLGVITMAVAWSGRRYRQDDADFSQVLAGRIALALDNAGLFSHLRRIERRMDTAMAVLDEAVVIHDRGGDLVFANPAAADLFKVDRVEQLTGATVQEIERWCRFYDDEDRPIAYRQMGELRATKSGPSRIPEIVRVEIGPERHEIWLRPRIKAVMDTDGEPLFAVTALEDVTEIKRAEVEQTLLGRSSELLAAADDYEGVLRLIADLLVPRLADRCTVDVLDSGGDWRRVARVTGDPDLFAQDDAEDDGRRSLLEVDLNVGGRRAGRVILENSPAHRQLAEVDRQLAVRFLERASIALEKARIAADRAEIAASLQHGLIPPPLPSIPSWDVGALYRPAGELNEVGGDFYESFRTDGGWVLVIGDVVGRGARAAAITAQARYTLRTAGQLSHDPAAALSTLNRALYARSDNPLCSAVAVVLKDDAEHAELMIAGHPRPLKVSEGAIAEVGQTGPILGAFENASWPVARISMVPGECLFLYTDGVTESESDGERFGDQRLREALLPWDCGNNLITRLEQRLEKFVSGVPRDDVAAVTVSREQSLPGHPWPGRHMIERLYDAFNRRSLPEMLAFCDPDIELTLPTATFAGRPGGYRGFQGIAQYAEDLGALWDDLMVSPQDVTRYGEWIIVQGRTYARSSRTGMRDQSVVWLWQLRGDHVYRGLLFPSLDRALSFAHTGVG